MGIFPCYILPEEIYFDKRERGAESDPARVALRLLSRASYRCSCFQLAVEAQLVIREISRFGLNPKQADLQPLPRSLPPSVSRHKNKHCALPLSEGMVHRTPTVQLIPRWGCVGSAKWMWWSSLRAASVILSHLPAKRGGRDAQRWPWRRDERGGGRESPCLQGGQAEWESPARRKCLPRARSN